MKTKTIFSTLALLCSAPFAAAQTYILSTSLDDTLNTGSVGTLSFTQVGSDTRVGLNADWNSTLLGDSVFLSRLLLTYTGSNDLTLPTGSGGTVVTGGGELPGAGINADAKAFGALSLVHLQGLQGGGSVKVITTPVPEPETWAMLGLGSIAALRRRRKA